MFIWVCSRIKIKCGGHGLWTARLWRLKLKKTLYNCVICATGSGRNIKQMDDWFLKVLKLPYNSQLPDCYERSKVKLRKCNISGRSCADLWYLPSFEMTWTLPVSLSTFHSKEKLCVKRRTRVKVKCKREKRNKPPQKPFHDSRNISLFTFKIKSIW